MREYIIIVILILLGIVVFVLSIVIIATDSYQETIAGWFHAPQSVIFDLSMVGIFAGLCISAIGFGYIYISRGDNKVDGNGSSFSGYRNKTSQSVGRVRL